MTVVVRVAALIRSNLHGIFSVCHIFCGIFGVGSGSISGVNSSFGRFIFPTTTTTTTININKTTIIRTSFITNFTTKLNIFKYDTPRDDGDSGFGWVLMAVVLIVGYWWL